MIIDELNKKIADIESLANDKTSSIESKVSDLTDGLLMVADAVDIIPEMVDEKITAITKEFSTIKETVSKVKAQKGEKGAKGDKGDKGDTGATGADGKDGSPDTGEQIADKLNELEGVLDTKVLKDFSMPDIKDLERQINTIGNQTLRLLSRPTSSGGTGTTTTINGLSGDVTLSAGQNISLGETGNNIEINANFTQSGKYMISGGAVWSGTGLTYDVSIISYFFNGIKYGSQATVTLDPSDPTNNRLDSIVIDEAGTISVITGTPSSSPVTPPIPEDQLEVQLVLVEAGSTAPTVLSESIYLDDPTTNWTFSTYTTGAATGSINFAGTNSPKQGTECIEASTDARLGARFVRDTSFDPYQYTMFSVWVRFTGTAVATNKSLNVRFENSAGTLVGSNVNLFSFGLSRSILNTWQLVVVPITAFGALPATVKGLKVIMGGGTVGQVRQWDIDYMILTNGSVPQANVPTIVFAKDGTNIASQSGINLIEGTGVTINAVNNPTNNRVDYTINASGGGGTPAGSDTQIQYNNSGSFGADAGFTRDSATGNTKIEATYGTDTYTTGVSNNLLGYGITGSSHTVSNSSGLGINGIINNGEITITSLLQSFSGKVSDFSIKEGSAYINISQGSDNSSLNITKNIFSLSTFLSVSENGISQSAGVLNIGNLSGGNNTKITIDDVNESIELNVGGSTYQASDIPKSIKVSVSSAEILSLNTTPKELIPAPGAGKYIDIISAQFSLTYGTTDYSYSPSPNDVTLTYGTNQCSGRISLNASTTTFQVIPIASVYDISTNTAVNFYCSTGNPTSGDSTVDIYLTYRVVTL